jgi:glycosyltransferase involved in cell wall biosynthesis
LSSLRWEFVEWSPLLETRIAALFDIGIMPLVDEPFQRGKCGCKVLQYMSASLPVVASPVGINCELIANGTRGLVASGKEGWREALAMLIAAPALRLSMGQAGRAFVEQNYSVRRWFPQMLAIVEHVAGLRTAPPEV